MYTQTKEMTLRIENEFYVLGLRDLGRRLAVSEFSPAQQSLASAGNTWTCIRGVQRSERGVELFQIVGNRDGPVEMERCVWSGVSGTVVLATILALREDTSTDIRDVPLVVGQIL